MARSSRTASKRPIWSIAFYLLLVLVGGLMLAKTARAEDQQPLQEDSNAVTGPIIGIDLGTTYSCVGIMKNGKVEIMVNDQGEFHIPRSVKFLLTQISTGNRITPSWVAFTDDERLVGDAAKNQYASNPYRTVFDVVSRLPSCRINVTNINWWLRNVSSVKSSTTSPFRMISSISLSKSSTRAVSRVSALRFTKRRGPSHPRKSRLWFLAK